MTGETYLTEEGLKSIQDELEYLKMTKRPEVIRSEEHTSELQSRSVSRMPSSA